MSQQADRLWEPAASAPESRHLCNVTLQSPRVPPGISGKRLGLKRHPRSIKEMRGLGDCVPPKPTWGVELLETVTGAGGRGGRSLGLWPGVEEGAASGQSTRGAPGLPEHAEGSSGPLFETIPSLPAPTSAHRTQLPPCSGLQQGLQRPRARVPLVLQLVLPPCSQAQAPSTRPPPPAVLLGQGPAYSSRPNLPVPACEAFSDCPAGDGHSVPTPSAVRFPPGCERITASTSFRIRPGPPSALRLYLLDRIQAAGLSL